MTQTLQRARTVGELIRGVVLSVVGIRLVLGAVNELRTSAEVVDLPTTPTAEPPAPATVTVPPPADPPAEQDPPTPA